ncbi:MBL fold metallo-hydrolase [Kitasatospora atroaurantiaca]|uniref:Glyoxylase-like metal-dependent hydrolase (Beta-lactamase superfamily II) n=1 Tax=Kitasatospora atroaurantiaca TaxID=285545 RepID=A0A561EXA0_9ACTN|nr:MBL fold metallo-hydrolase [Kitasatospora atroaurantiaca]TWE20246.1 glyoxylase-like metal-dependent hydrolase (beta-lactamase superfamily II) [Kitasatospora atroaurantiaca]
MKTLAFEIVDFPDASLNKTAVLVTGPHEALLVDAGFTLSDGRRLVQGVKNSGKRLTTVFISHGDPDFYFGAEVVQDAFPDARFLAPPLVVDHIRDTYPAKREAWGQLGDELSTRLVLPEPLDGDLIDFEGHRFELRGADFHLPDRHYLWEHRHRAVLGGVLLFQGLHVWTADTPTAAQRGAWIDLLDGMEALDPLFVAAGHRTADAPSDGTAIAYTREYLKYFETEIGKAPDAAGAQAELERLYPDAGLRLAVELGTKVAKGELEWR